jgi:hypothetical protein
VLAREHQLGALVVNRRRHDHDPGRALGYQRGDDELGIERVADMDRREEPAGKLGERDQALGDRMREAAGPGRGERQHLQPVRQQVGMAVGAAIFDVVMDRMIVAGEELERGEMRRRNRAAGIAENFADPEVRECPRRGRGKQSWIERIVHAGLRALRVMACILAHS